MSKATDPIHPVIKSVLGVGNFWQPAYAHHGISLRDHIAIEVMKGMVSDPHAKFTTEQADELFKTVSTLAYKLADAMIAESQKP